MSVQNQQAVQAVHSVQRFVYTVSDLNEAQRFYAAFGLDAKRVGDRLDLHTFGHSHCWASLFQAPGRKRLQYVAYGIHAQDEPSFRERVAGSGLEIVPHLLAVDAGGIWLRDPDGIATQLIVGPKVSPSAATSPAEKPTTAIGQSGAFIRAQVPPVRPRYLSHVLRQTPDVLAMTAFCCEVLGLRLSDRSEDIVAFIHSPHGSDHHLVGFTKSNAPGLHHSSWDVGSFDEVGAGAEQMRLAGWGNGWGVGRHVLGSNYFHYVEDPWGSFCEYSAGIDYIPAGLDWKSANHHPENALYQWGPPVPPSLMANGEQPPEGAMA